MEWYVLRVGYGMEIVSVIAGNDPLYGHGGQSLLGGPFSTWDEAEQWAWDHCTAHM